MRQTSMTLKSHLLPGLLSVMVFALLTLNGLSQAYTYSENFPQGTLPNSSSQCLNWQNYIANLNPQLYVRLRLSSPTTGHSIETTNLAIVQQIATNLKNQNTTYVSYNDGINTWWTGGCSGMELSATSSSICQCVTAYTVRPCINNNNWGGINTSTCGAPTQVMTVEFFSVSGPDNAGIIDLPSLTNGFCAGILPVTAHIVNEGNNILDSVYVDWTVNNIPQPGQWFVVNLDTMLSSNNDTIVTLGNYTFLPNIPYTVQAWTSLPNNVPDTVNGNDTILVNVSTSLSGNYTVNSTLPTGGNNFQTFNDMANALNTFGVCGPVVINVTPNTGPYLEQIRLNELLGSSPVNTVRINGNGNTLTFSPTINDRYILHLNGTDYLTVDSLNITGTNATYGYGIVLSGDARFDTIRNCRIDLAAVTSTSSTNSAGILINGGAGSTSTTGIAASDCFIANNIITGGPSGGPYSGIYMYSTTNGMKRNTIQNNTVTDFYSYGHYMYYADSCTIRRNSYSRPNRTSLTTYYGMYFTTGNTSCIIDGNRFHNPYGSVSNSTGTVYGMYCIPSVSSQNQANTISNNLVYNINTNGTAYGIYLSSMAYTRVYHNTVSFDITSSTGSTTTYGIYHTGSVTGVDMRNNIITIARGGTGNKYALYYNSTGSISASNNNIFHITATQGNNYLGYYASIQYPNLATWQAGTLFDANSHEVNPLFISPGTGNFRPGNSIINNTGANLLTVVPVDITGTARTTTPDPGAYEFTVPADDAGIQTLVSPNGNFCSGTQNVTIQLVNYGTAVLNSATVNWTVNNAPQTPLNLTNLGLASLEDTLIQVGTYNFLSGQTYQVVVWTSNPNGVPDLATYNDTVVQGNLSEGLSGNYTINPGLPPSATNYQSFTDAVNDLSSRGVCSPVIFDVASGTYTESLTFGPMAGVSPSNTITFRSAASDSNQVILTHASTLVTNGTINLMSSRHLRFEEMTLMNTGSSYKVTVYMANGASDNRFSSCVFVGDTVSTSSTSSNYSLVYSNLSNDTYNVFEKSRFRGNAYGFYLLGNSGTDMEKGNVIRDNWFDNQTYTPVFVQYQDSITITGNTIDMNSFASTTHGISVNNAINACNISGNTVIPSGRHPFYPLYFSNMSGGTYERALVSNNMIANGDNLISDGIYGLYFNASGNINVVNNSIHLLTSSDNATGIYTTSAGSLSLYNNIVNMANKGRTIFVSNSYNIDGSDHNLLRTGSSIFGVYNNFAFLNLAGWQNFTQMDSNSISVDPQFQSDTVLRTCNLAINGAGKPLSYLTTDIDGDIRNINTPDIGADEFTAAGAFDLGPDILKCAQDTVTFGGEVISGNTYQWNTLQTTPEITTNQAGTYIITVTSSCGTATDTIVVTNIPLPSAMFTSTVSFYTGAFTYTGSGATQWHWDFGDNTTSSQEDPYHIYANNGSYIVTLTTYNDCGDSATFSQQVIINVPNLSINDPDGQLNTVNVFPNPSDGLIQFVYLHEVTSQVVLQVFDQSGRVVYSDMYQNGVNAAESVDLRHLPQGSYFMRLQAGDQVSHHKLIITR